jgi:hypothetical protein
LVKALFFFAHFFLFFWLIFLRRLRTLLGKALIPPASPRVDELTLSAQDLRGARLLEYKARGEQKKALDQSLDEQLR